VRAWKNVGPFKYQLAAKISRRAIPGRTTHAVCSRLISLRYCQLKLWVTPWDCSGPDALVTDNCKDFTKVQACSAPTMNIIRYRAESLASYHDCDAILIPPLRARTAVAHELSLTKTGFDSGRNRAGERTTRKTLKTSPTATLSAVFCNRERQRLGGLCQTRSQLQKV